MQPIIHNILCPVDFSEISTAAVGYAARLAKACSAEITALHTYWFDAPPYFTPSQTEDLKLQYQNAAGEMRRAVEMMTSAAAIEKPRVVVVEGDPAGAINRTAELFHADLVVMGTHGRRGIERFMLGSVAERVLRTSGIPVLTVRGKNAGGPIRQIMCPVDNSEPSRAAFRQAAQFAVCLGAQIIAVHVTANDTSERIDDLCAWIGHQETPKYQVDHVIVSGKPAEEILKLATERSVDLLVIGAARKAFFDSTVLGSTTVRVVRHASCPVLTVIGSRESQPRSVAA